MNRNQSSGICFWSSCH